MTDSAAIELARAIPTAPASVWAALTDPAQIARWWAAGDIQPVVGHAFSLDMGAFGAQRCTVLEADTERRLVYTFGEGMLDTTITWTLEAREGGTFLTFEQAGFDLDSPMGVQAYRGMSGGWPAILDRLVSVLAEV